MLGVLENVGGGAMDGITTAQGLGVESFLSRVDGQRFESEVLVAQGILLFQMHYVCLWGVKNTSESPSGRNFDRLIHAYNV